MAISQHENVATSEQEYGNATIYPSAAAIEKNKLDCIFLEITNAAKLTQHIASLNQKLTSNSTLHHQYKLFLANQLQHPHETQSNNEHFIATPEFLDLLKAYQRAANAYDVFKKRVIKLNLITQDEITEIEQGLAAARNNVDVNYRDSYQYRDQLFFPLYQHQYELRKKEILTETNLAVERKKNEYSKIKDDYSERRKTYVEYNKFMASVSYFVLPFFLLTGGLVSHAIDKIVTSIRKRIIEHELNHICKTGDAKIVAVQKNIENQIAHGSVKTIFRQGFFKLRRTQHEENIVENITTHTRRLG